MRPTVHLRDVRRDGRRFEFRARGIAADASKRGDGFLRDCRGNIAMLFAFMTTVLFLFVGGALDYTRWNAVRADMIEAMDSASLAVAQMAAADDSLTDAQLKDYGLRFFEENFAQKNQLKPGWEIDFDLSNKQFVSACVDGALDTYLLSVAGITTLDVDKCVQITKKGSGRIELSLVLDVTGSMDQFDAGEKKITSLRKAVKALLDVLFDGDTTSDNLMVGIVPFNQHINPGGASSWKKGWGDPNAKAFYHGRRFFHVDENGVIDMSTKVNHYSLFDSDPENDWAGCVEARPYPLDELDTPPGSATTTAFLNAQMATPSAAEEPDALVRNAFANAPDINSELSLNELQKARNSRWVPMFLGDEPDCNSTNECVYGLDGITGGIHWYGYWFDDPDDDNLLNTQESSYLNRYYINDQSYTRNNQGSAFTKYVKVVDQFRNVLTGVDINPAFEDWLDSVRATQSGSQEYILRAGYPGWWNPVTEKYEGKYDREHSSGPGPNYNCPEAILPLTNSRSELDDKMAALNPNGYTNIPIGAIWGWRVVSPGDPFDEAIGEGETGPGGSQFEDWTKAVVIMTDGNNDFADRNTHWGSDPSAHGYEIEERMGDGIDEADGNGPNMEDEADDKVLRICRRMKQDKILVYAIVFDVNPGSAIENVFKSCATKSTAPYFFNAPDGEDLEDAFKDIAADLVDLHISK